MRASQPALLAAGRVITELRDQMVVQWADWLGDRITAAQARKLACEAEIIPLVLGGKSQPLDVGRGKRFHEKYQRIALHVRDKHCTTLGCDWPAALCHVHHNTPWSSGGKTSVKDGRLLCPRHHTYAHSPKYQMKTIPNGRVIFSRS